MVRIKKDKYLKKFVDYCRNKFGNNLLAVLIYGSYSCGYFDKKKSDYDVFVIFKDRIPKNKEEIQKKFHKITLQYFLTINDLSKLIREGHWSVYITILKSAGILYRKKEYNLFLRKLRKIDFWEELIDLRRIKFKNKFERENLKKSEGFRAVKIALATIRRRLSVLTSLRKKKLIWDFNKNLLINEQFLDKEEINFLKELNKKLISRSSKFNTKDKKIALRIFDKLTKEIDDILK